VVCATNGGFAAGWKDTKISRLTARQSRDLLLIFGAAGFVNSLDAPRRYGAGRLHFAFAFSARGAAFPTQQSGMLDFQTASCA